MEYLLYNPYLGMVLGTKGLIICKRFWSHFLVTSLLDDLQGYDQPKLQDFQVWKQGWMLKVWQGSIDRSTGLLVGDLNIERCTFAYIQYISTCCVSLYRVGQIYVYIYIFISMLSCTYIYLILYTHIFSIIHIYIYIYIINLCTFESTYLYIHVLAWCIWGVSSTDLIYACLSSIVVQPYMI